MQLLINCRFMDSSKNRLLRPPSSKSNKGLLPRTSNIITTSNQKEAGQMDVAYTFPPRKEDSPINLPNISLISPDGTSLASPARKPSARPSTQENNLARLLLQRQRGLSVYTEKNKFDSQIATEPVDEGRSKSVNDKKEKDATNFTTTRLPSPKKKVKNITSVVRFEGIPPSPNSTPQNAILRTVQLNAQPTPATLSRPTLNPLPSKIMSKLHSLLSTNNLPILPSSGPSLSDPRVGVLKRRQEEARRGWVEYFGERSEVRWDCCEDFLYWRSEVALSLEIDLIKQLHLKGYFKAIFEILAGDPTLNFTEVPMIKYSNSNFTYQGKTVTVEKYIKFVEQ